MKCLIVSSNRWNSAITEYALALGRALLLEGAEVAMVLLTDSPAATLAKSYRLQTEELTGFGLRQRKPLYDAVAKYRPSHVIACGGAEETLLSTLVLPFALVRFRGQDFHGAGFFGELLRRGQSRKTVGLLFPSDYLLKKSAHLFRGKSLKAICLGTDSRRFSFSPEGFSSKGELVIFGRIDPIKGHRSFLRIYSQSLARSSREAFPPLHIIGEPANVSRSELEMWIVEAGLRLNEDVKLSTQRISDPKLMMNRALLGIVCSLGSELICRVAEEFLLCGTPIFVSGVGSLNETLFEGAGQSYQGKSEVEAADLLCQAVATAAQETSVGRTDRALRAAALFSLESMGMQVAAYLKGLSPNQASATQ